MRDRQARRWPANGRTDGARARASSPDGSPQDGAVVIATRPAPAPSARRRPAAARAALRVLATLLLIPLGFAGCATSTPPTPTVVNIRVDAAAARRLQEDMGDEDLLAAMAWYVVHQIGLPLGTPLSAYFFTSQHAFEAGLIARAGVETSMAREQARFATGVGTADGMFLRADRLNGRPLLVRAGLYAHELVHLSQYHLAGGKRAGSEQWLREGFADWVRFRALDHFRLRPYAESRRRLLDEVRLAGPLEVFPGLGALVTSRQWIEARAAGGGRGNALTYGQAFLAVDWLAERVGHPRIVDYFRRFRALDDRVRNFREAFGMPAAEFHRDFRARLAALL